MSERGEIMTIREAERQISELIDRFDDTIFIEACQEMESSAQTAWHARQDELDMDE